MADKKPLKISYCTTCKGRLHHLKQTLPANMAAERNNPNVEFVVLDYGSEDGLGDWIKQNFQAEMDSGRLRYARYEAPHFKMAHAKNMAHRVATGDVLCNVDADNFIAKDFSKWLRGEFNANSSRFVTCVALTPTEFNRRAMQMIVRSKKLVPEGLGGRIAVSRDSFVALTGYDESMAGWGRDDSNFALRAKGAGLDIVKLPQKQWGVVIEHGDEDRLTYLTSDDRQLSLRMRHNNIGKRYFSGLKNVMNIPSSTVANPEGNVGCGTVHVNFSPAPTAIKPLTAAKDKPEVMTQMIPDEDYPARRDDWSEGMGRQSELAPSRYRGR